MRARLVRPEFWADSKVGKMSDGVRLFYIGLWCVADDAGFVEWDLPRIAADLMPYRGMIAREKRAAELAAPLVESGRVVVLECQRHALIPTLERHRIAGGKTSERVKSEHVRICAISVRTPGTDQSRSESLSPSLSESHSLSPSARRHGAKTGLTTRRSGKPEPVGALLESSELLSPELRSAMAFAEEQRRAGR